MSELKTSPNDESVEAFLNSIEDERKRTEAYQILNIMKDISQAPAKMWGKSIVGFGSYHYKYKSGREGDWFLIGFSPRKQNHSLYLMSGFDKQEYLLQKLGKYKTGKSCLYIKQLKDVDVEILKDMLRNSIAYTKEMYGDQ